MTWASSKVSQAFIASSWGNTADFDLDGGHTLRGALYGNTGTPDQNAAASAYAYNAGQWVTANEVYNSTAWPQAGVALTSPVLDTSVSAVVKHTASTLSSPGTPTMSAIYGVLLYDDTLTTPVADQGYAHIYLGGSTSSTAATYSIAWPSGGIFSAAL